MGISELAFYGMIHLFVHLHEVKTVPRFVSLKRRSYELKWHHGWSKPPGADLEGQDFPSKELRACLIGTNSEKR